MNKHPINHVFQGIKHPITSQVRQDWTGLACYRCYDKNGACAIDPRNEDYRISGIPTPCIGSNFFNSGGECALCSDKPCPTDISCLSGFQRKN